MTKEILVVILIPFLTAVLFSNTLIAEFLTDYEFSFEPLENNKTGIVIYNDGRFQANNVLISFLTNDTTEIVYDNCPEGTIIMSENNQEPTIIDIPRMTPRHFCAYNFEGNLGVQNIRITSDDRMTVWKNGKSSYNPLFTELVLVGLFVAYGVLILYLMRLPWKGIESLIWLKMSRNKFIPSEKNNDICKFVKKEYRTTINDKDAGIIEAIFCGKDTPRQILAHTILPHMYVRYRLRQLEEKDLIKINPIALDDTLKKFLESVSNSDTKKK